MKTFRLSVPGPRCKRREAEQLRRRSRRWCFPYAPAAPRSPVLTRAGNWRSWPRRSCTRYRRGCRHFNPRSPEHGHRSKWSSWSLYGAISMDKATQVSIEALKRIRGERRVSTAGRSGTDSALAPTHRKPDRCRASPSRGRGREGTYGSIGRLPGSARRVQAAQIGEGEHSERGAEKEGCREGR